MRTGGIYYSDFHVDPVIQRVCLETLKKNFKGDDLVSVTLKKPLDLGRNIALTGRERSYPTMVLQILTALEDLKADYVFFLEHDVLYSREHFDFMPLADNVYFYNINNYRWLYPQDYLVNYDALTSLSMMCCNRDLALKHYRRRLRLIEEQGLEKQRSREPRWARQFGYEPGTKKRRRGGVTDEDHVKVRSAVPNIDIRHRGTFSSPKCHLEDFKHPPEDFKTITMSQVPGWDLKGLFGI